MKDSYVLSPRNLEAALTFQIGLCPNYCAVCSACLLLGFAESAVWAQACCLGLPQGMLFSALSQGALPLARVLSSLAHALSKHSCMCANFSHQVPFKAHRVRQGGCNQSAVPKMSNLRDLCSSMSYHHFTLLLLSICWLNSWAGAHWPAAPCWFKYSCCKFWTLVPSGDLIM